MTPRLLTPLLVLLKFVEYIVCIYLYARQTNEINRVHVFNHSATNIIGTWK